MLFRLLSYLFFSFFILSNAYAASPWEGRWSRGRYNYKVGGIIIINECTDKSCKFELYASHGGNTCQADGTFKINGNHAEYYKKIRENGDNFDERIAFELNPDKRVIEVKRLEGHFCGWNAFIDGTYEHESLPMRYPTSFDCWAKNLTQSEIKICASEKLSKADLEFDGNYKSEKNDAWYQQRNLCLDDEECLLNFYKKSIRQAFEKKYNQSFSLYNYVQKQQFSWHSPTDLFFLNEFLEQQLPKGYFGPLTASFDDYAYNEECSECIARDYEVNGFRKIYESSFYIDQNQVWLAFVSANLEEPEDKNILVFAPMDKKLEDMPTPIKDFVDYLTKSNYYDENSVKLKHFQDKPSWIEKIRAWFE